MFFSLAHILPGFLAYFLEETEYVYVFIYTGFITFLIGFLMSFLAGQALQRDYNEEQKMVSL